MSISAKGAPRRATSGRWLSMDGVTFGRATPKLGVWFTLGAMSSLSLDKILHRARALCVDAGLDPDRLALDGRPEWFRFLAEARASLRRDQEARDPLELLKAIDSRELARAADVAHPENDPESVDPLQKLEALYEKEMREERARAKQVELDDPQKELSASNDFTGGSGNPTASLISDRTDPLDALKALEAVGSPKLSEHDSDPELALPSDDHVSDEPPTKQSGGGDVDLDDDAGSLAEFVEALRRRGRS